jgi:hypothetical protein
VFLSLPLLFDCCQIVVVVTVAVAIAVTIAVAAAAVTLVTLVAITIAMSIAMDMDVAVAAVAVVVIVTAFSALSSMTITAATTLLPMLMLLSQRRCHYCSVLRYPPNPSKKSIHLLGGVSSIFPAHRPISPGRKALCGALEGHFCRRRPWL